MKISKTSKLDNIKSWSLPAVTTCPGSRENGELVQACSGCYATTGHYVMGHVKAIREYNFENYTNESMVSELVAAIKTDEYFRWFDSGDIFNAELAKKIYEVIKLTPKTKHWIPTRSYKSAKIKQWIDKIAELPNAIVRFSADSIDGTYIKGFHGSVIISDKSQLGEASICTAYETNGKCSGCRKCWDKTIPTIAYPAHGRKMKKIIAIKAV